MSCVLLTNEGLNYVINELDKLSSEERSALFGLPVQYADIDSKNAFKNILASEIFKEIEKICKNDEEFLLPGDYIISAPNGYYYIFTPDAVSKFKKWIISHKNNDWVIKSFGEVFKQYKDKGINIILKEEDCAKWLYEFAQRIIENKFNIELNDSLFMFYK